MCKKQFLFGVLAIGLIIVTRSVSGEILLRNTFENYEGDPSSLEEPWIFSTYGEGNWYWEGEPRSPKPEYQKQAHGELSIHIRDPNNTSYANVIHRLPAIELGVEYMVEFYLWVPSEDQIDDMYLYKPTVEGDSADVQLLLHSVNGQTLTVHVRDKNGIEPCGVGLESGI